MPLPLTVKSMQPFFVVALSVSIYLSFNYWFLYLKTCETFFPRVSDPALMIEFDTTKDKVASSTIG